MTWAQRLKRVFNIDIETCAKCGGAVNVIASSEDPTVIKKRYSLTWMQRRTRQERAGCHTAVPHHRSAWSKHSEDS
jgi:hypothetical protein